MSDIVIRIEDLWKQYRFGVIGHGTLKRDFQTWWARKRGKIDPNIKLDIVDQDHKSPIAGDYFWALRGVNLEVKQGEILGIIGKNGAGKSTLFKILSRITAPSRGCVKIKGRIASLLEIGTGFHAELSGRENIFLNGSILGMTKHEIKKKLDQIIDFSGVEKFIETPVKRYSSGMYVRLAFAVAAHLESEILLIDEVLAVGDVEFQKKCLGKIEDVAQEGRTVLFVSHNMNAVSALSKVGTVLDYGKIIMHGSIIEAVRTYNNQMEQDIKTSWEGEVADENIRLLKTWVKSSDPIYGFHTSAELEIGIEIDILKPVDGLILGFTLWSEYGYELAYVLFDDLESSLPEIIHEGKMVKKFKIPKNMLASGTYKIIFDVGLHMKKRIIKEEGSLLFKIDNMFGMGMRYPLPASRGKDSFFRPETFLLKSK